MRKVQSLGDRRDFFHANRSLFKLNVTQLCTTLALIHHLKATCQSIKRLCFGINSEINPMKFLDSLIFIRHVINMTSQILTNKPLMWGHILRHVCVHTIDQSRCNCVWILGSVFFGQKVQIPPSKPSNVPSLSLVGTSFSYSSLSLQFSDPEFKKLKICIQLN